MTKDLIGGLRPAVTLFVVLSIITGLAYPLLMTGLGKALFAERTAGSLVEHHGKSVGSALIGQHFSDPKYFWGRPSATSPMPNNASASSGSNFGPLNPALTDAVKARADALNAGNRAAGVNPVMAVPVDLVTASGSGLDPHISPAAALFQAPRVARLRNVSLQRINALILEHTEGRTFGFIGEPRINVLQLNLALESLKAV